MVALTKWRRLLTFVVGASLAVSVGLGYGYVIGHFVWKYW